MGINKSAFKLLYELKKKHPLQGSVLQLGRQHTFLTQQDLQEIMGEDYAALAPELKGSATSFNEDLKKQGCVDDITLFKVLGFDEVHSMDGDGYEQSTYVHDLNLPVAESLWDKYDFIFDGGTSEHVFNIPQVLKNIHKMLKKNGLIVHGTPTNNFVDHGFYMFSPTFYHDYYTTNKYGIVQSYYFEIANHFFEFAPTSKWKCYEYKPGCLDDFSFGGFGKEIVGLWFVAEKQEDSTDTIIPQQTYFLRQWAASGVKEKKKSEQAYIKSLIKKIPFVFNTLLRVKKAMIRRRRVLVGKY